MKIEIEKDVFIETDEKSMKELLEISDDMQSNILYMRDKIEDAKVTLATTGEYADGDWFRRIHSAVRITAYNRQVLIRSIAGKKKQKHKEQTKSFERRFMIEARKILSPTEYEDIIDRVNSQQNGES